RRCRSRPIASSTWEARCRSAPERVSCAGGGLRDIAEPALQAAESAPVLRRAQCDMAAEQPAEEARVLVADLGRDRLDRRIAGLEHLLGLLQPQRVHVFERAHPGGLREAALEAALAEP